MDEQPNDKATDPQRTPAEIEADIEAQRERLAATVDDLAAKIDVKARARDRVSDLKQSATTADGSPRPEVLAALGSVVAVAVVVLIWRRRR